jgi:hypothetical protein
MPAAKTGVQMWWFRDSIQDNSMNEQSSTYCTHVDAMFTYNEEEVGTSEDSEVT